MKIFPTVVNNFLSDQDRLRLLSIIDEEEHLGHMYRNPYSNPGDDGRIMLWNTGHEEFWGIIKKYLKSIVSLSGETLYPHDVAMLKYYPGPGMKLHSDQDGPCSGKCKLTSVIYLNNDYIGGEVVFPNLSSSYKLDPGSVMYFHQEGREVDHEIVRILDGKRYAIITCYSNDLSMLRDVHKDFVE